MKPILSLLAPGLLLQASSALCAVQLYSNGNLVDPTPATDISHAWSGGFTLTGARSLASSFILPSESLLESVNVYAYDTLDGSGGSLSQVSYAIYTGDSAPSGSPIASGNGAILSSAVLPGHRFFDTEVNGQLIQGLYTFTTSFQLISPVDLKPGTKYWLVLAAVTDPLGVDDIAQWADSDLAGGFYLADGTEINGGRAFELYGELVVVTPASIGDQVALTQILVTSLSLPPNSTRPLLATLSQIGDTMNRISDFLNRGNNAAAANSINAALGQTHAFLNKVNAFAKTGRLSSAQASTLTTAGNDIADQIAMLSL
jgi:hypothetical protein